MTRGANRARGPLRAVLDLLDTALMAVAVTLLAVVALAVTWQVLARYVTRSDASWATELATISFVWLALITIALGVRRSRHMALDIWEYLPANRWVTRAVETVAALIVCAVLAALVWFGSQGLEASFRRSMPGLGISYGWISLAVPAGSAIALVFAVEAWWSTVRTHRHPVASTTSEVTREPAVAAGSKEG